MKPRLGIAAALLTSLGCFGLHGGRAEGLALDSVYLAPGRQFSMPVASWRTVRRQNMVSQSKEYTCGAASLATILKYYYEAPIGEEAVLNAALGRLNADELADRQENGLSMEDLATAAKRLGYASATLELKFDKLSGLPMPVVVRLVQGDFKHFVVLRGVVGSRVFVADPLRGNSRVAIPRFQREWDGKILAVVKPGQKPRPSHALEVDPCWPVTPEVQAARRDVVGAQPRVRRPLFRFD